MNDLKLGKIIHSYREKSNMSVRQVAIKSGITPSMLSQIENDLVNPSINTLRSIAQVLSVPMYAFFLDFPDENEVIVHPNTRNTLGIAGDSDVTYELLTPDTKGDIEFCMMTIPLEVCSFRDQKSHIGEEVAFVYEGDSIILELGENEYELTQGDSVRIPSNIGHTWYNNGKQIAKVIFAITPPSF